MILGCIEVERIIFYLLYCLYRVGGLNFSRMLERWMIRVGCEVVVVGFYERGYYKEKEVCGERYFYGFGF